MPYLRGAIAIDEGEGKYGRMVCDFRTSLKILDYVNADTAEELATRGVSTPDLSIRIKTGPMVLPAPEAGKLDEYGKLIREKVAEFLTQIAEGIGAAHGVSVSVAFNTEFIETINAEGPTQAVVAAANAQRLQTIANREPMSFSEDFAHFAAAVPGCFLLMGNGEDGPCGQPLHSADYDFNDDLLPIGAAFWARLVRDRLPKSERLEE